MKRKTNVQIVKEIMEHSNYGALSQSFVIQAITKYADACAAAKPEDFGAPGLINYEAWIGVAKEIKDKLDTHYKEA